MGVLGGVAVCYEQGTPSHTGYFYTSPLRPHNLLPWGERGPAPEKIPKGSHNEMKRCELRRIMRL